MTSPAEPASTDATQASQLTKPLRELAAFALLGANAVFLFVGLIRLATPTEYSTFGGRAGSAFYAFVGVESVFLPLLAVLLATHVKPPVPKAKLITQVALGEYAVSALFGGLTFLFWTVTRLADGEILDAFLGLLSRVAWLALFAVAAYVVFKIWRTLYYVPKPKPQPGVYGQPQPGWPQQQGGYPAPGQQVPGQQVPGQQVPGQQGGWQAPGPYGAPYGQQAAPFAGGPQPGSQFSPTPQSAPPFGQAPQSAPPPASEAQTAPQFSPAPQFGQAPQSAPPAAPAPQSAPPFGQAPQSAPPFGQPQGVPPFGQPPSADPTQAIPRQSAELTEPTQAIPRPAADETDRTQRINPGDTPDAPR
ncbi:hypothetical protein [Micromonospora peucetia]|uniref:Uncharacterized protein n=1 Tax=Micromonospora peucetia TaxID=47871 RepID=A0A1C6UER7_9ACTN|nr:hypothetical protein [Micromonospora peucetia]WSA33929.1 hypothetical protein OIE14_07750 [Micromonospora peucetia]SCL52393.1 hypothetical protein GA0070608_1010 [Micromonospora peucetia]